MPELPEVETIVRDLRLKIIGQQIERIAVNLPKMVRGNQGDFASRLRGLFIKWVRRRGKNIIVDLTGDLSLLIHLKMTGQLFYVSIDSPLLKHTHFIFDFVDNDHQLRYSDKRQFGHMHPVDSPQLEQLPELAKLGPDPLEITLEEFAEVVRRRRRKIKPLLLDQTVLAGLGNIYTDEALHRAGIHPEQLSSTLSGYEVEALYRAIQGVLRKAIEHAGSSVDNYLRIDARPGDYQRLHQVYRCQGKPCSRCDHPIVRKKMGGRGTYFCPHCQKIEPPFKHHEFKGHSKSNLNSKRSMIRE